MIGGFSGGSVVKNPPANAGDRFNPWVWKIPWRKKWLPTLAVHEVTRVRHNLAMEQQQQKCLKQHKNTLR